MTIFSGMFTIACCLGVGLGLWLGLDFGVWLVSCNAHVFVRLQVVIVTDHALQMMLMMTMMS